MKKFTLAILLGSAFVSSAYAQRAPEKAADYYVTSAGAFTQTFELISANPVLAREAISVSGQSTLFSGLSFIVVSGSNTSAVSTATLQSPSNNLVATFRDSIDNNVSLPTTGSFYVTVTGVALSPATVTVKANYVSSVTAVPEPESYAMLLAGLGIMGGIARRRMQK